MGRSPCCSKEGLNRGAWTAREDKILTDYIKTHGEGRWRNLPKKAGLKRCGKSCRLRWLNYLRPDIKRGNISHEEEELIVRLHKLLGNRWSLIAGRLPGRTDNEIKNYWNTNLGKKTQKANSSQLEKPKFFNRSREKENVLNKLQQPPPEKGVVNQPTNVESRVVRTKATRCTKIFVPLNLNKNLDLQQRVDYQSEIRKPMDDQIYESPSPNPQEENPSLPRQEDDNSNVMMDFDLGKLCMPDFLDSEFLQLTEIQDNDNWSSGDDNSNNKKHGLASSLDHSVYSQEAIMEEWLGDDCFQTNIASELQSLASFFDSEGDWL